jgi:hypothetical protein
VFLFFYVLLCKSLSHIVCVFLRQESLFGQPRMLPGQSLEAGRGRKRKEESCKVNNLDVDTQAFVTLT